MVSSASILNILSALANYIQNLWSLSGWQALIKWLTGADKMADKAEAFRTLTGIPQRLHQQVQGPENSYSTKRQVPYNHLGEKLLEPSPKVRRVASMPESKEDISFWVDEGVPCHPPLEVRTTTWQGIASNITYLQMDFLYFYE